LFTGTDLTTLIEQDNSYIRHYMLQFRRRTKVVPESKPWLIYPCVFTTICWIPETTLNTLLRSYISLVRTLQNVAASPTWPPPESYIVIYDAAPCL